MRLNSIPDYDFYFPNTAAKPAMFQRHCCQCCCRAKQIDDTTLKAPILFETHRARCLHVSGPHPCQHNRSRRKNARPLGQIYFLRRLDQNLESKNRCWQHEVHRWCVRELRFPLPRATHPTRLAPLVNNRAMLLHCLGVPTKPHQAAPTPPALQILGSRRNAAHQQESVVKISILDTIQNALC